LFVLRHPSKEEIHVYETATFTQQRTVRVAALNDLASYFGLASCVGSNCLYVSDCRSSFVHKVDLSSDKVVCWRIKDCPYGLSVSRAGHVIVACYGVRTILEYTSRGSFVREIQLQPDVGHPQLAVQLTSSRIAVSCHGADCDVCVVDEGGSRVACYNGTFRSTTGTFSVWNLFSSFATKAPKAPSELVNWRTHLAVDARDSILVAESDSGRLVLFESSLSETRELTLPIDGGWKGPSCLHYVDSCGRLFIGELINKRVLVFDDVLLKNMT